MVNLLAATSVIAVVRRLRMKDVPSILLLLFLTTGCVQSEYGMQNKNNMDPWGVRTNFSNDETWELIKTQVSAPQRDPITRM
jgi:PBP1b-binding outer membrane lipoprotein LpoB